MGNGDKLWGASAFSSFHTEVLEVDEMSIYPTGSTSSCSSVTLTEPPSFSTKWGGETS